MGRDNPFQFTDLFFDPRRTTGATHAFNRKGYVVFILGFNIRHNELKLKHTESTLHYQDTHFRGSNLITMVGKAESFVGNKGLLELDFLFIAEKRFHSDHSITN